MFYNPAPKQSWALRSSREHSGAFLDSKDQVRVCCHDAMSTLECSWVLMSAEERSQVLTSAHSASAPCPIVVWALKSTHDRLIVLMWIHGTMIMSVEGCSWVLMSTKSTNEHSLVRISTIEHGADARWALVSTCEHSSAFMRKGFWSINGWVKKRNRWV